MAKNYFEGKTVLVTGAGSGIGRACAFEFADNSSVVIVSDINEETGKKTITEIKKSGGQAIFVKTDISKEADVKYLIHKIKTEFGKLNFAVNNAGVLEKASSIVELPLHEWNRVISTNLTGNWLCLKYELPLMKKSGKGAIVNISSILGLEGASTIPAYVASKHGIIGLTKVAAREAADTKIRVNALCPPAVRTSMQIIRSGKMIGMKPEEIAKVVFWLCSPKAARINGKALIRKDWEALMKN